jgi:hypothetical protein
MSIAPRSPAPNEPPARRLYRLGWAAVLTLAPVTLGCGRGPQLSAEDQAAVEALKPYSAVYKLDNNGRVIDLKLEGKRVPPQTLDDVRLLTELRQLSLYGAPLTDDCLAKIKGMPQLQGLGLGNTPITDQALAHLERIPNLRWLWLSKKGKVTAERVEQLKKAVPGLTVYLQ